MLELLCLGRGGLLEDVEPHRRFQREVTNVAARLSTSEVVSILENTDCMLAGAQ